MSMRCEEVRPLLAELVYEEVEPAVAEKIREHLGTCLPCRRHQNAFLAVRTDLQEWKPAEESVPHGMTFIAPTPKPAPPIWHSRIFQGLAAAAGFMFLAVLTAAATNMQVASGPDGWTVSTSFGQPAVQPEPEPLVVSLDQIPKLDEWFDARLESQFGSQLKSGGVVTLASMPTQQFLTDGQVQDMSRRVAAMLDSTLAERDLELGTRFENMEYLVESSLEQQTNNFFYATRDLVDDLEAEHRDQVFELGQEFGNVYSDTNRRLMEANLRIDNLENTLAAFTSRSPEQ